MRLNTPLISLALTTTATAIDIRFMTDYNCNGFSFVCTNIGPGTCCYYEYWQADDMYARIAATPRDWILLLRGYGDKECKSLASQTNGVRGQDICMNQLKVHSAKWEFFSKKREEDGEERPEEPCRLVDSLYLADGTKYDIQGLGRGELEALVEVAKNGSGVEEVPEYFKSFKIET